MIIVINSFVYSLDSIELANCFLAIIDSNRIYCPTKKSLSLSKVEDFTSVDNTLWKRILLDIPCNKTGNNLILSSFPHVHTIVAKDNMMKEYPSVEISNFPHLKQIILGNHVFIQTRSLTLSSI